MATVSLSYSNNVISAALSGTFSSVKKWDIYLESEFKATVPGNYSSLEATISKSGNWRFVCTYYTSYTTYEVDFSGDKETAQYNDTDTYELFDSWDVDPDTGEVILGSSVWIFGSELKNYTGYYTRGGKLIAEVHSPYYYYYQYYVKSIQHTEEHSAENTIYAEYIPPTPPVGNAQAYIKYNNSWIPVTPYIYYNNSWIEVKSFIS